MKLEGKFNDNAGSIWMCACGCTHFMLRRDGKGQCVKCDKITARVSELGKYHDTGTA